ncbi:MAG: hypothetical protein GY845_09675 [Planctomycetes bacterium]|nr:hypothetical protein [Planctomycetota bacterium]
MRYPKLDPVFSDCCEVGMGSPFNVCGLKLTGKWVPSLPNYDWYDKYAHSPNNRYLALVAWSWSDDDRHDAGFKIIVVDTKTKTANETNRIPGCCKSIQWSVSGFQYDVYGYISETDFTQLKQAI